MSRDNSAIWQRCLKSRHSSSIEKNSEVVIMNSRGNIGSVVAIIKESTLFAAGDKMLLTSLYFILKLMEYKERAIQIMYIAICFKYWNTCAGLSLTVLCGTRSGVASCKRAGLYFISKEIQWKVKVEWLMYIIPSFSVVSASCTWVSTWTLMTSSKDDGSSSYCSCSMRVGFICLQAEQPAHFKWHCQQWIGCAWGSKIDVNGCESFVPLLEQPVQESWS